MSQKPDFCSWCFYFQPPCNPPQPEDYLKWKVTAEQIKDALWGWCSYLETHLWDAEHLYNLPCQKKKLPQCTQGKVKPKNKTSVRDAILGKDHVCCNPDCQKLIKAGIQHLMTETLEYSLGEQTTPPQEKDIIHACSVECAELFSKKQARNSDCKISYKNQTVYPLISIDATKPVPENHAYIGDICAICTQKIKVGDMVRSIIVSSNPPSDIRNLPELPRFYVNTHQECSKSLVDAMVDKDLKEYVTLQLSGLHPMRQTIELKEAIENATVKNKR